MPVYHLCGGRPLAGRIDAGGSHAALPSLLCAGLLTDEPLTLHNLPHGLSATTLARQAGLLGLTPSFDPDAVSLTLTAAPACTQPLDGPDAAPAFAATLSRHGSAVLMCHDDPYRRALATALRAMGAVVTATPGRLEATASRLHGARLNLPAQAPDTLTAALLLAASLANGETVLQNASQAPETVDLARCLTRMGATIYGIGTAVLTVHGSNALAGTALRLMPDRWQTLALLCAALISRSHLVVHGTDPQAMEPELDRLVAAGATVEAGTDWISLDIKRRPRPIAIPFGRYPAASATMLPLWLALAACAQGSTTVTGQPLPTSLMSVLDQLGVRVVPQGTALQLSGTASAITAAGTAPDADTAVLRMLAALAHDGTTTIGVPAEPEPRLAVLVQALATLGVLTTADADRK